MRILKNIITQISRLQTRIVHLKRIIMNISSIIIQLTLIHLLKQYDFKNIRLQKRSKYFLIREQRIQQKRRINHNLYLYNRW